ncbi:Branched-chain amino acid ABC transporter, amino acid-binding protein [Actinokineospora spheciospongiae]|uniref:Branched-chain amino acid ABC transporter, amino acid-binding protein n=1 Tax=Actinokineospora spheciospongiae TaxID=909613 RepID=W7IRH2_9PSEU|nr:ABC transporter substrate-binding protein [Actinokineospora spheciospongiae]EWC59071.1 Branched-chain amino acid ABC transporter, amino acid-binding protein [Actinokineospora spheciospongiae]
MAGGEALRAAEATRRAIGLAESGDAAGARGVLREALLQDAGYEPAWVWLAALVERDGERRFCLEKALAARPSTRTRRSLRRLRGVEAVAPVEVEWAVEPPLPPEPEPEVAVGKRRRWRWVAVAGVLVVLAGAGWGIERAGHPDPVHLALVAGLTGPEPEVARGVVDAVRMALDEANQAGGVNGHPVELLVFDDGDDVGRARVRAEEVVEDGRALAVVGHVLSDTSLAAAPVYAGAELAAITPSATADRLTTENPWYFRTVFGNHAQSGFAAVYLAEVLGASRVSVLSEDTEYGRGIHEGFVAAFGARGTVAHDLTIAPARAEDARAGDALAEAVATLRADPDPGPILLAAQAEQGLRAVTALRAAGITAPLFAADALADEYFHDAVSAKLAQHRPAPPLGEVYAVAPMSRDALTGSALQWATSFRAIHGYTPSWHAATAYESAIAALHALRTPDLEATEDGRAGDRRRVRAALAAMTSAETAPEGVLGPIRFDPGGSTGREIAVVRSNGSRFVSAPVQLAPYAPRPGVGAAEDVAAGRAVELDGQLLTARRVVTAGVNLNEVGELDTEDGTFFADFFLWLRYTGDDTAADLTFVNAVDPDLALGAPLRTSTTDGQHYRLYRVAEEFKAAFDFRDFPFDHQHVTLVLQNRLLPETQLVYVTDPAVLTRSQSERLRGGANASASIDGIPNWTAEEVQFYRETVGSTAELGDPAFDTGTGTYYSQYVADVRVQRDIGGFLVKNLLPLALLVALTYLSLYFPPGFAAGYSIGITAILTSAVLLAAVTSPLPEVSYTVAIEWAYYAFILMATCCLLTHLVRQRLTSTGRDDIAARITVGARIVYPAAVTAVALTYAVVFA